MAVLKRKTNNGWESVALPVLDQTPTEGSNRGVTSGGVYNAIQSCGAVWGNISGTLSNQTDLQSALDDKTHVVANPATTSADLTGITIGSTSYKVSGMESGTAASQGLVWNGTQWVK